MSQPLSRLPTSTNSELEAANAQLDAANAKLEAATAQAETAQAIQRLAQKLYAVGRGDEYFAALDDPALMDKLLAEFGEA